jgi:uncharacterized protein (TIGR03118 family)
LEDRCLLATGFLQTNLVSDISGMALHLDPNLVNPWGIAVNPNGPIWISDNGTGLSTLYDGNGNLQSPVVTIPPPSNGNPPSGPSGIVFNSTSDFVIHSGGTSSPALFIFATEDGTISAWSPSTNFMTATREVDNTDPVHGPVFKGLAIGNNGSGNFLYAADIRNGTVDVFDKNFNKVTLSGSFTDGDTANPLPAGFSPFGIQNINGQLFVTYAKQNATKDQDVPGAGNGFVDVFDLNGNFVRRLASQGTLNSPWGLVMAPATFGSVGGDLLVGNLGDGRINIFNPSTGNFLGQLSDSNNMPITINGLWGLAFGNNNGMDGSANTLFFTAGINNQNDGLFGTLTANVAGDTVGVARNGTYFLSNTNASYSFSTTRQFAFGAPGDITVQGDWTGSGSKSVGVFRPSTGQWFLDTGNNNFSSHPVMGISFGQMGDVPVVGKWLGTSTDFIGVFRPSTGQWFLSTANANYSAAGTIQIGNFGEAGDVPVVGNWRDPGTGMATGATRVGVFRPMTHQWFLSKSNGSYTAATTIQIDNFGMNGDIPVVGKWNAPPGNTTTVGDKLGVFRPSTGQWFLSQDNTNFISISSANVLFVSNFGAAGDMPVVGDWTGTGSAKIGIFRPSSGTWFLSQDNTTFGTGHTIAPIMFGSQGDMPLGGAWQLAGLPQLLDGAPGDGTAGLSMEQLQAVAAEALGNWQAAGLNASQLAMLQGAQFDVTNLPSGWLGESLGNVVLIDATADGHGWSVDGPVVGQVDLLTVVEHEMGHLLGLSDVNAGAGSANLMSETLAPGMRRGPDGTVSLADPTGGMPSIITPPSVSVAALSSADSEATGRGADASAVNWPSLDRYFAGSPQVDAVPDGIVDGRVATSTWHDDAGQIQEERDDFFAASA